MNIVSVPLSELHATALNARRTGGASIDDLAASISHHGLIHNLVVTKAAPSGAGGLGGYLVVAGGRRLSALAKLQADGALPTSLAGGIPCRVVDLDEAQEARLAENVIRQAMHPADEFDAFAKLATGPENASAAEIAARFGKSERYVQQRMKLANVAPEILKQYRDGKATLEQMMALALSDDQALQARVWKAARSDWQRQPDQLRKIIVQKEISTEDDLGAFVGVEAYEKAGGKARRDLFDDEGTAYMSDVELVRKLAQEKLERTVEKIAKEGWKWVEARIDFDYSEQSKFGRIYPNYKGSKQVWTDQEKAQAGAIVTIAHNGQAEIERGLVRPEDRRAAEKSSKSTVNGGKKASDRKPGELSFAAIQHLQAEGGSIVATEVAQAPAIALKLLAAELADDVFYSGYDGPRTWVHIVRGHTNRMPDVTAKALKETCSAKQRMTALEQVWRARLPKKRDDARAWIFEQSDAVVQNLLAFLVAREIDVVDFSKDSKGGIVELATATKVDLGLHWKPTPAWLATLPKAVILALAKDAGASAIELATLGKLPKAKLPEAAAECFEPGWLPKPLRPAKVAAKKSPAKKAKRAT